MPDSVADAPTLAHLWRARVEATPSATAFEFRRDGTWATMTWRQADAIVRRIAAGLVAMGVDKGARVAIFSGTRVEWVLCDFAILCAGAATSTIYPTSTAEECAYILGDAECQVVFVEDLDLLARVGADLPHLKHRIVMDPAGDLPDGVFSLAQLQDGGATWLDRHPQAVDARIDTLGPGDLATLIYTSGTTGPPKGVMLVHDNWMFQAQALQVDLVRHLQPGDKQYLFLPLAHAYGKLCELIAVSAGAPTAIDPDPDRLLAGVAHSRPTLIAAVPRVFEKIHLRIASRARSAGAARYAMFRWAVDVGVAAARHRLAGRRVPWALAAQAQVADRLVFRRLRAAFGGRLRAFASGGAPLSEDLALFFYAAGMTILEGYGMTETSAGAVGNTLDDFAFGTVGRPIPGSEVRISDQGEVQIRGRHVMRGYWRRPDATAEALDPDGWLHTGDLGQIDGSGRLHITGRIKDLIVTSGGKNIAPQRLENQLKATCPYLSEVVVLGDRRPYCVALAWLDIDAISAWADHESVALPDDDAQIAAHPAVVALVDRHLAAFNADRARHENIVRVHLVGRDITAESDLLTPSLKVRRDLVAQRYAAQVAALYPAAPPQ